MNKLDVFVKSFGVEKIGQIWAGVAYAMLCNVGGDYRRDKIMAELTYNLDVCKSIGSLISVAAIMKAVPIDEMMAAVENPELGEAINRFVESVKNIDVSVKEVSSEKNEN